VVVSLPFKLIFFVLVDGWRLVAGSLVESFHHVAVSAEDSSGPHDHKLTGARSAVGLGLRLSPVKEFRLHDHSTPWKSAPGRQSALRETIEILKTVGAALLIALVLRIFLFQPYTIPSRRWSRTCSRATTSSSPSSTTASAAIRSPSARRCSRGGFSRNAPARGDVVVFKLPRE